MFVKTLHAFAISSIMLFSLIANPLTDDIFLKGQKVEVSEIKTEKYEDEVSAIAEAKNPIKTVVNSTNTSELLKAIEEKKPKMSAEDIELIALVMLAEAEGECEEGQRMVISTVLNRVDSEHFPNTVHDVIYQKGQFSSMWCGRTNRVTVTEEARNLVQEEVESRTNTDVIFFRTEHYHPYGKPLFQVGSHYFSSYD